MDSRLVQAEASKMLVEELNLGGTVLPEAALLPQAVAAAEDLLLYPRVQWPIGANAWEKAVLAIAFSVRRLSGRWNALPIREAVRLVHGAAEHLAAGKAR